LLIPSKKNNPDREANFLACQNALEPYIEGVISAAVTQGWDEMVATEAIIALGERHALAKFSDDVEQGIKRAPPLDPWNI
jgi:hypothetical protein